MFQKKCIFASLKLETMCKFNHSSIKTGVTGSVRGNSPTVLRAAAALPVMLFMEVQMAKKEMVQSVASVTFVDGVNRININSLKGDFVIEIDGKPLCDSAFVETIKEVMDDAEGMMERYLRFSRSSSTALAEGGFYDFEDALCNGQIAELLFAFNKNATRYKTLKE